MIGFDGSDILKDLRKNLLFNQHIFTMRQNRILYDCCFTGAE